MELLDGENLYMCPRLGFSSILLNLLIICTLTPVHEQYFQSLELRWLTFCSHLDRLFLV